MHPNDMTGLQLMQAFAQGLFPRPGISKTMPMDAHTVEHGRVVFTATANETHTNPMGGVHGGFAATFHGLWPELKGKLALMRRDYPDARVWITGHSMGGAMAVMAGLSRLAQSRIRQKIVDMKAEHAANLPTPP